MDGRGHVWSVRLPYGVTLCSAHEGVLKRGSTFIRWLVSNTLNNINIPKTPYIAKATYTKYFAIQRVSYTHSQDLKAPIKDYKVLLEAAFVFEASEFALYPWLKHMLRNSKSTLFINYYKEKPTNNERMSLSNGTVEGVQGS